MARAVDDDEGDTGLTSGQIAAIVSGSLLFLCCACCIWEGYRDMKECAKKEREEEEEDARDLAEFEATMAKYA